MLYQNNWYTSTLRFSGHHQDATQTFKPIPLPGPSPTRVRGNISNVSFPICNFFFCSVLESISKNMTVVESEHPTLFPPPSFLFINSFKIYIYIIIIIMFRAFRLRMHFITLLAYWTSYRFYELASFFFIFFFIGRNLGSSLGIKQRLYNLSAFFRINYLTFAWPTKIKVISSSWTLKRKLPSSLTSMHRPTSLM